MNQCLTVSGITVTEDVGLGNQRDMLTLLLTSGITTIPVSLPLL